ncbi:MAG: (deoxy)nucleoside triphosphate pyrophosphohydrolase [Candidatus Binatia bacterium]
MSDSGAPMEVVAALIYRDDRLLVCQRKERDSFPLKWEFPGGKVERGEGPLGALRRELREELGIEVQSAREVFRHAHSYSSGTEVELIFYRVKQYSGVVMNLVFQELLWVDKDEIQKLDFLEGDRPLIELIVRGELE